MALLYQLSYNGFLSISTDSVTNIFLISDYPVKKEYSERLLTPLIKSNQYSESIILIFVGREGFEPPKPEGDRFTVCCDRPLHHLPAETNCCQLLPHTVSHSPVSLRSGLNRRPTVYKTVALPTELLRPNCLPQSLALLAPKQNPPHSGKLLF